ncbi:MAG TPA: hypothetical protein VFF68_02605, partial [Anaerolineaceae bacterium]|nr:hypothetical protein [Anaerolineaceae bacterium]
AVRVPVVAFILRLCVAEFAALTDFRAANPGIEGVIRPGNASFVAHFTPFFIKTRLNFDLKSCTINRTNFQLSEREK